MRGEKFAIRPVLVGDPPETAHSRTLVNPGPPARHFLVPVRRRHRMRGL
jgi:hypothetical protein